MTEKNHIPAPAQPAPNTRMPPAWREAMEAAYDALGIAVLGGADVFSAYAFDQMNSARDALDDLLNKQDALDE